VNTIPRPPPLDAERAAHARRRHDGVCGVRPGAGAYGAGGVDDEGVGNLRSKSFVNLIEIVGGWSLSEGRHGVPYLID
jgi:hypothetical protein